MPRRVLSRDNNGTSRYGQPATASALQPQPSGRPLRLRNPPRGHQSTEEPMSPQRQQEESQGRRGQRGRSDRRDSGTQQHCRLESELSPDGRQPALCPQSGPESSPEPERRPHSSPERLTRSASPEPASRLVRRVKRQRRLHEEASPVAASPAGRRPAPGSARRCLFGPPDHAALQRSLHEEQQTLSRADTLRWNFDFEREEPFEGPWQWERVAPAGATAREPP